MKKKLHINIFFFFLFFFFLKKKYLPEVVTVKQIKTFPSIC